MFGNTTVDYDFLKREFRREKGWGVLLSLDLHKCNPKIIRSAYDIRVFTKKLVKLIGMNAYGQCKVVNFGSNKEVEGFSMVQLIDSSLISGHFANKTNNAYIDVFSCRLFDPKLVVDFSKEFFNAKEVKTHCVIRK